MAELLGLEDSAHDFSGAGFGERSNQIYFLWDRDLPQFLFDLVLQGLNKLRVPLLPVFEDHKGFDRFTRSLVWLPDDGRLGDSLMADQGAFHLGGADPVARHLDYIIRPPHEPEVPILVLAAHIAGRVAIRNDVPIGPVAIGVFVNRAHHGRPRLLDDCEPTGIGR